VVNSTVGDFRGPTRRPRRTASLSRCGMQRFPRIDVPNVLSAGPCFATSTRCIRQPRS